MVETKLEATGILIEKFEIVKVSDKFNKREFVIEIGDQFKQQVKFQTSQTKTGLIETFAIRDIIKVSFNLHGKKWKDSYFNNLDCWKIEKVGTATILPLTEVASEVATNSDNDLPF